MQTVLQAQMKNLKGNFDYQCFLYLIFLSHFCCISYSNVKTAKKVIKNNSKSDSSSSGSSSSESGSDSSESDSDSASESKASSSEEESSEQSDSQEESSSDDETKSSASENNKVTEKKDFREKTIKVVEIKEPAKEESKSKTNFDLLLELEDVSDSLPIMTPTYGGFLSPVSSNVQNSFQG